MGRYSSLKRGSSRLLSGELALEEAMDILWDRLDDCGGGGGGGAGGGVL